MNYNDEDAILSVFFRRQDMKAERYDIEVPLPKSESVPKWLYALDGGTTISLGSYANPTNAIKAIKIYFNRIRKCGKAPYYRDMKWTGGESCWEAIAIAQHLEIASLKEPDE